MQFVRSNTVRSGADVISGILNCVRPECGGRTEERENVARNSNATVSALEIGVKLGSTPWRRAAHERRPRIEGFRWAQIRMRWMPPCEDRTLRMSQSLSVTVARIPETHGRSSETNSLTTLWLLLFGRLDHNLQLEVAWRKTLW
jgi:hypothetical protein